MENPKYPTKKDLDEATHFTKYFLKTLVHLGDADGVVTMLEDAGYDADAEYVRETYFEA